MLEFEFMQIDYGDISSPAEKRKIEHSAAYSLLQKMLLAHGMTEYEISRNENGKPFTLDADGFLARIIQHEYDHLDGIIYIDRGDKEFAEKTEAQFKKRAERAAEKAKLKEAKAKKIAAKIAAKEAKKNK